MSVDGRTYGLIYSRAKRMKEISREIIDGVDREVCAIKEGEVVA